MELVARGLGAGGGEAKRRKTMMRIVQLKGVRTEAFEQGIRGRQKEVGCEGVV